MISEKPAYSARKETMMRPFFRRRTAVSGGLAVVIGIVALFSGEWEWGLVSLAIGAFWIFMVLRASSQKDE